MTAPTCATCKWWNVPGEFRALIISGKGGVGDATCKRYPPDGSRSGGPRTLGNDFCGEHATQPPATERNEG